MPHPSDTKVWPSLRFADADSMLAWLTAIGFTEHATHRADTDPSIVVHAEWLWPEGGGIMFGSKRDDDLAMPTGSSTVYLVTDNPDAATARAIEAGATVVRPLTDQDYGGRDSVVRDPEGNLWSFGTYQPT